MWKKSLAMVGMLGTFSGLYASGYNLRPKPGEKTVDGTTFGIIETDRIRSRISSVDHNLDTWQMVANLKGPSSFRTEVREHGKRPVFILGGYPADAKLFNVLEPEDYETVCSSVDNCRKLLGDAIAYIPVLNDAVLVAEGPSSAVITGEDWVEIIGKNITLEAIVKTSHLILSDGEVDGKKIIINAVEGKPFYIRGTVNFLLNDLNFIHSDIKSVGTKHIVMP